MNQMATKNPNYSFEIKIINGPEKGAKFKLLGSPVFIGRGVDNHISLPKDPKISRQHAKIVFTQKGIEIIDTSKRQRLIVNGVKCEQALLINNSKITIGDSELIFNISQVNTPVAQSSNSVQAQEIPGAKKSKGIKTSKNGKKSNGGRIIIYGILALVLYLVFSDNVVKKNDAVSLKTDEIIEQEMKKNKELQKILKEQSSKKGTDSVQYREAQATFVRGFRDFKNTNYASSMDAFQACLSLFPEHQLCKRYYRLAYRKHNELIQYNMVLAQQYKEQGQYKVCAQTYKIVMTLLRDPSSKVYIEAKLSRKTCLLFMEENY
ncbi:MAG: FHA domain-containing protein [Bdellovibrionaceae bacterium]|nr:FHA domain-containing protein [Pseudobdellovibrionaceae bacterium]